MKTEPLEAIRAWLAQRTGLSAASLGEEWVDEMLEQRRLTLGCEDLLTYSGRLFLSLEEQETVIQATLVHESWFFREPAAFACLRERVVTLGSQGRVWRREPFRVLSMPCASGEEPYSIAMALLDAGMSPDHFRIEAADLSRSAIERARKGEYRQVAVRGVPEACFHHYAEPVEDGFRVSDRVRVLVHFQTDNAVQPRQINQLPPFDAIFCRNLLVYLTSEARRQTVHSLKQMLAPGGLLLFGHADIDPELGQRLKKVGGAGAFAYEIKPTEAMLPKLDGVPNRSALQGINLPVPQRRTFPKSDTSPEANFPSAPSLSKKNAAAPTHTFLEAEVFANHGQHTEALSALESVLTQEPLNARAWSLAGTLHWTLGGLTAAETAFRKALYLSPADSDLLLHFALFLEETGRAEEAHRLRRRLDRSRSEPA